MTCCRRFELSSRPSITGSTIAFAAGQRRPRPPRCRWKSSTAPCGFGSRRRRAAESATSTSTSRHSLIRCCSRPVIFRGEPSHAAGRRIPRNGDNRDGAPMWAACDPGKYSLLHVRPGCCGLHRELEDTLPVCGDGFWHRFRTTLRAFPEGRYPCATTAGAV
jgi:hypothetical protein